MPSLNSAQSFTPGKQKEAVDFSFKNIIDGKMFTLSELNGQVALMVFSSVYCKACKKMLPKLDNLYKRYKSSGLVVLVLDIDKPPDEKGMNEIADEMKISFPFLMANREIAEQYGVVFLPTVFLVDQNRVVVKKYIGPQSCKILADDFIGLQKQASTSY